MSLQPPVIVFNYVHDRYLTKIKLNGEYEYIE